MCLTNELLLDQFDQNSINLLNDTPKKKALYDYFVKYIRSLNNPEDLEKVLRFATGSKRIPVYQKILVYNQII